MSFQRRKQRMTDANGRELYKLTVDYLFHIQNKSKKEVVKIMKDHNLIWVKKCRSFNRSVVDPNPHGFREMLKNKKIIKSIQKELSLDPPKLNWFQRLVY